MAAFRKSGLVAARRAAGRVRRRLIGATAPLGPIYRSWVAADPLPHRSAARTAGGQDVPGLAIVMAVHDPPLRFLTEAIDSVRGQIDGDWELILSDDNSTNPAVCAVLDRVMAEDPRITLVRPEGTGIVAALNAAVAATRAAYFGVLDHDDLLHPRAVAMVLDRLRVDPELGLLYSDEDKVSPDGHHFDPYFKPDYAPELLLGQMYLNHFTAMRTDHVRRVGSFREGTDGAQDHDLAFRLLRDGAQVGHLPGVLYHWRAWHGSTATGIQAKPWAQEAAARVQRAHLTAIGYAGSVEPSSIPGLNEVHPGVVGQPRVTVIIPSASTAGPDGVPLLLNCLSSVAASGGWPETQVVVVHTNEPSSEVRAAVLAAGAELVVYRTSQFNFAQAINLGAAHAVGDYLLLLNDDTTIRRGGAILALLEYAQLPGVGAVGARLSFPDGRNQHSGMVMIDSLPTHAHYGAPASHTGYFGSVITPRNYLAVTGAALMTPTPVFRQLGGLDERWPHDYQDVDYCLRLGEAGMRVCYTPYAHFEHVERASLVRDQANGEDTAMFLSRWGQRIGTDPYYSVLLSQDLPLLYLPR